MAAQVPRRFRALLAVVERVARFAVTLYAVALILLLLLHLFFGDRFWPLYLFSLVLGWLLLPALVLCPLFLWRRHWETGTLLGVNVVALLWLFGGLYLPHFARPQPSVLIVMTYNVADDGIAPDTLVTALRASGADLVALEELTEGQATAVRRELAEQYPYQALYPDGIAGVGLLSRYPIAQEELFYLQMRRFPHLHATVALPTGLGTPATPVTVIVAHPEAPIGRGNYQPVPAFDDDIAALAQIASSGGPTILLGDFNLGDQGNGYRLLKRAGLADSFREAGWGFGTTWPARKIVPLRLFRLDYIWHTADFQAVKAWTGPDAGSDHVPVLAALVWRTQ